MTIAAGFVCSDGVVLASDSLWVGAGRRHYAKIRAFADGPNLVVVAGAGLGMHIKHVMERVAEKLTDTISVGDIRQLVHDILLALFVKVNKLEENIPAHLREDKPAFLIAVRTPAGLSLFENQGEHFLVSVSKSQCIGCGNTLGLYLADWLFDESLPMQRGRAIASYLIHQVKRFEPDYCGGATQIWMIPQSLERDAYELPNSEVSNLEAALESTRAGVKKLIAHGVGVVGVDFNGATSERRQEAFDTSLSAATTHYDPIGQGSMRLAGQVFEVNVETPPEPDDPLSGVIQRGPEPED